MKIKPLAAYIFTKLFVCMYISRQIKIYSEKLSRVNDNNNNNNFIYIAPLKTKFQSALQRVKAKQIE